LFEPLFSFFWSIQKRKELCVLSGPIYTMYLRSFAFRIRKLIRLVHI
jgi:hypothetical protein